MKESAKLSSIFLVLMVLSTLLATTGLFQSSAPVIIGAMVLAPLMAPIVSLAMGIFGNGAKKEVLHHANIKDAKSVIIAIDNPHKLYHMCHTIKRFVDSNKIYVKVHSEIEKTSISDLGITNILVENELTSSGFFELINSKE